ncbi:MAG: hypothetical protein A3D39_01660 [Candidatus Buchananbacteria bacterium RIFCSPHIGHO2_02_FULL_39_17]|nr:MAG: hypothetical protein A3D39_01660 [Candidatus Buchananbacteria bacterium RIFCSPHIGHO2_02_FULL_39_17]
MQKISSELESEIIQSYNGGLSLRQIAQKFKYGKSTVRRVLFRNNIPTRPSGVHKCSDERKREIGQRTARTHKELKERDQEEYSRRQKKAAEKGASKGGLTAHKNNPNLAKDNYNKTIQKHPDFARMGGLAVQKTGEPVAKLLKWKYDDPERARKVSSETMKKTLKIYPDLPIRNGKLVMQKYPDQPSRMGKITMSRHPKQASLMGKSTHQKHPNMSSERLKQTIKDWKKRDLEGYYKACASGMQAAGKKRVTIPEKLMGELLPDDFIFNKIFRCNSKEILYTVPDFRSEKRKIIIEVDGPTHYKTLGKRYGEERLKVTILKDNLKNQLWKRMGYQVYRFTDQEIIHHNDEVREKLKKFL